MFEEISTEAKIATTSPGLDSDANDALAESHDCNIKISSGNSL